MIVVVGVAVALAGLALIASALWEPSDNRAAFMVFAGVSLILSVGLVVLP